MTLLTRRSLIAAPVALLASQATPASMLPCVDPRLDDFMRSTWPQLVTAAAAGMGTAQVMKELLTASPWSKGNAASLEDSFSRLEARLLGYFGEQERSALERYKAPASFSAWARIGPQGKRTAKVDGEWVSQHECQVGEEFKQALLMPEMANLWRAQLASMKLETLVLLEAARASAAGIAPSSEAQVRQAAQGLTAPYWLSAPGFDSLYRPTAVGMWAARTRKVPWLSELVLDDAYTTMVHTTQAPAAVRELVQRLHTDALGLLQERYRELAKAWAAEF